MFNKRVKYSGFAQGFRSNQAAREARRGHEKHKRKTAGIVDQK